MIVDSAPGPASSAMLSGKHEPDMEIGPDFWKAVRWAIPFWVVVAIGLVILFNFESPSSKVMGFPLSDVIVAGLVIVVWIGAVTFTWMKRRPRA